MTKDNLKLDQLHRHNVTGAEVRITNLDVLTKDDSDSGWSNGVEFVRADGGAMVYVRKRADFLAKYCVTDCPEDQ